MVSKRWTKQNNHHDSPISYLVNASGLTSPGTTTVQPMSHDVSIHTQKYESGLAECDGEQECNTSHGTIDALEEIPSGKRDRPSAEQHLMDLAELERSRLAMR